MDPAQFDQYTNGLAEIENERRVERQQALFGFRICCVCAESLPSRLSAHGSIVHIYMG